MHATKQADATLEIANTLRLRTTMQRHDHRRDGRGAQIALRFVLCAGALTMLALNWPGQFSPDSIWQLQQGRTGIYNAWHPPVMAWMLGVFDSISPGAPGFIVFDALLCFGGLYAFAALAHPARGAVVLLAAALCGTPLLLIYQGTVWKDVLFADASVAGFAALAWSARQWHAPLRAAVLLALAFALFALAGLTRQNGVLVVLGGAGGVAAIAYCASNDTSQRGWRAISVGLAGLAFACVIMLTASVALDTRSDHLPARARELAWLQVWDLAGMTHAGADDSERGVRLKLLDQQAPRAATFIRTAAAPAYSPLRVDPILDLPNADDVLDATQSAIAAQWWQLIETHPLRYARIRAVAFWQMLATPNAMACRPLFVGIDGPSRLLNELGLQQRARAQDRWLRNYSLPFVGTPVFSHLLWSALALLLIALALRDLVPAKRAEQRMADGALDRLAVVAMLGSALAFTASFSVIGMACDYRYLYPLDLAAMAALLHRVAVGFASRARLDA